jgi:hypothetical protein
LADATRGVVAHARLHGAFAPGEGLLVKAPGRRARVLADSGRDLAMAGGTVYRTDDRTLCVYRP